MHLKRESHTYIHRKREKEGEERHKRRREEQIRERRVNNVQITPISVVLRADPRKSSEGSGKTLIPISFLEECTCSV